MEKKFIFSETKDFSEKELEELFLSVNWSSGKYPEKLKIAMENSHRVFSVWDNGKLIGLMNSLSDGIMTAYFHYLLVNPLYHNCGLGRQLVAKMLKEYEAFPRKVLIAYDEELNFYKNCGFSVGVGKTPMFITTLTT